MKIPVISVGDKVIGTADPTVVCYLHLESKEMLFQLEVSENKYVIFFLYKFMNLQNSTPG